MSDLLRLPHLIGRALLVGSLLLGGCAHRPGQGEVLAQIDTSAFVLPTVDGAAYALADHRGKVVVMQFFATYCVPCLAELNQLQALADRSPAIEVVAVGLDLDGDQTLRPFRDMEGLRIPVLVADAATRDGRGPFGRIPQLPTTVVIDRAGVVRSAFGGLISNQDLEHLLDEAR